jgi:hypothetical protein
MRLEKKILIEFAQNFETVIELKSGRTHKMTILNCQTDKNNTVVFSSIFTQVKRASLELLFYLKRGLASSLPSRSGFFKKHEFAPRGELGPQG